MRKIIAPALTFLLGVTLAVVIYRSTLVERPAAARGPGILGALARWLPVGEPDTLRERHAKAARLLQSGQLRQAQDAFLEILSVTPRDEDALRGLASVRRYMAGDNPTVLRRQAAEYWDAIRRGAATAEHYSPGSMEALLAATLQAVQEIEARGKPVSPAPQVTIQGATPPAAQPGDATPLSGTPPLPAARPSKPTAAAVSAPSAAKLSVPASPVRKAPPAAKAAGSPLPVPSAGKAPTSATSQAQAKPAGPMVVPHTARAQTPATPPAKATAPSMAVPSSALAPKASEKPSARPAQAAAPASGSGASPLPASPAPQPAPPAVEPAASVSTHLYTVRVGPLSDRNLAAAIATQLSAGGFSTNVSSRSGFRVVSEPLPRNVAEGLAASLAGRGIHAQAESLGGDSVQLVFGSFASQKEAEALSQRVSAQGYDAWVREGTVYTLQLGPYPQSSVTTISGIVKSNAPGAAVTADPVP